MPNIKSAKKRVKVNETKSNQNSSIKTSYKTAIKKFDSALESKDNIDESFRNAVKAVDKACSNGILKKNTANRKKSSLSKKLTSTK